MIKITKNLSLHPSEVKFTFVASSGPGGQNVNKVATAAQLRFNVLEASLPPLVRERLIVLLGKKLTAQGELIIKANRYRTQESNKQDALDRLCKLIKKAAFIPKKRKKTKPPLSSKKERLESKKLQGRKKALRKDFSE